MIEKNLIRETGKGESTGGKPLIMLEFTPDSHFIIGVDIGLVGGFLDVDANVKHVAPSLLMKSYRKRLSTGLYGSTTLFDIRGSAHPAHSCPARKAEASV